VEQQQEAVHGLRCLIDEGDCPDTLVCEVLNDPSPELGESLREYQEAEESRQAAEDAAWDAAWEAERVAWEAEERKLVEDAKDAMERERTTWAPVDLAAVLAGDLSRPQPTILQREDGRSLLYPGRTHSFIGESEHGKSLAAYLACAQELIHGRGVVYVDFEGEARDFASWMVKLGVSLDVIAERARYIRPDDPLNDEGKVAIRRACMRVEPTLVVFDGVTEAMMLHDLNDNATTDTARFMKMFPRQFERVGVAALLIDHAPHDGARAIGSQHKRASVTGSSFLFRRRAPLRPGQHGKVDVSILKDRPGSVREFAVGSERVGTLHVEPVPEDPDRVWIHLEAPPDSNGLMNRPLREMEEVSVFLEQHLPGRVSRKAVERDLGKNAAAYGVALDQLVLEGFARSDEVPHGNQVRRYYTSVKPFRRPD
jgi:KaiC/GvpD/RAD55 family RecA-like ATPase